MSIILNNVYFSYDKGNIFENKVLKNINLEIKSGEIVGIAGKTGSGKSTLVQLINGLIKPDAGEVYYNGQDINDDDYPKKKLRRRVSMVFQNPDYALFENSVMEEVKFGPVCVGMDKLDADLSSYNALKSVGLDEKLYYDSPMSLSTGEKKRVCIASALAVKPEVLILDEPFAGLDYEGKTCLYELLYNLHEEENITLILISHNMEVLADIVDRLVVLHEGSIIIDDTTRNVFYNKDILYKAGLLPPDAVWIMDELKKRGMKIKGHKPINTYEVAECIFDCMEKRGDF